MKSNNPQRFYKISREITSRNKIKYKTKLCQLMPRPWEANDTHHLLMEFIYLQEKYGITHIEQYTDDKIDESHRLYYTIIRFKNILFKIDSNYPISIPQIILYPPSYIVKNNKTQYILSSYIDTIESQLKILNIDISSMFHYSLSFNIIYALNKITNWWNKWHLGVCLYKNKISKLEMLYLHIQYISKIMKQMVNLYLGNKIFENMGLDVISLNKYYPIGDLTFELFYNSYLEKIYYMTLDELYK